jgi:hypothetical protein
MHPLMNLLVKLSNQLLPPRQRGQPRGERGLQAALGPSFADDTVDPHWRRQPLERGSP